MKKYVAFLPALIVLIAIAAYSQGDNNVKFSPDRQQPTLETTQEASDAKDTKEIKVVNTITKPGKLAVTSLESSNIKTTKNYHVIRGTAPKNTYRIKVNDYQLVRYYPGQTQWSYIASESIGTLKEGKNKYTVVALNADGKKIDSINFKITYKAPIAMQLPSTGNEAWFALLIALIGLTAYRANRIIKLS